MPATAPGLSSCIYVQHCNVAGSLCQPQTSQQCKKQITGTNNCRIDLILLSSSHTEIAGRIQRQTDDNNKRFSGLRPYFYVGRDYCINLVVFILMTSNPTILDHKPVKWKNNLYVWRICLRQTCLVNSLLLELWITTQTNDLPMIWTWKTMRDK